MTEEDTTPNERSAILALAGNYLKRTSLKEFAAQARGGVGRRAAPLAVEHLAALCGVATMTRGGDTVHHGHRRRRVAYAKFVRAFKVPQASRAARGSPLSRVLPVDADRSIAGLLPVSQQQLEGDQDYVVLVTKQGLVKRTPLSAYGSMTSRGKIAIRLNEGDAVGWAALCTLGDSLVVATAKGMLLKYDVPCGVWKRTSSDAMMRETARCATMGVGVKALKLRDDDELATARVVAPDKDHVLVLTAAGYGKRVDVPSQRTKQFRGLVLTPSTRTILRTGRGGPRAQPGDDGRPGDQVQEGGRRAGRRPGG